MNEEVTGLIQQLREHLVLAGEGYGLPDFAPNLRAWQPDSRYMHLRSGDRLLTHVAELQGWAKIKQQHDRIDGMQPGLNRISDPSRRNNSRPANNNGQTPNTLVAVKHGNVSCQRSYNSFVTPRKKRGRRCKIYIIAT